MIYPRGLYPTRHDGRGLMRKKRVPPLVSRAAAVVRSGALLQLVLSHGRPAVGSSSAPHESQAMPRWAVAADPALQADVGEPHFCSYDIDHPLVETIWSEVLEATLPPIADAIVDAAKAAGGGASATQQPVVIVQLANEPAFTSANSNYTATKWRAWLENLTETSPPKSLDAAKSSLSAAASANATPPALAVPVFGGLTPFWLRAALTNATLLRAAMSAAPPREVGPELRRQWSAFNQRRVEAWLAMLRRHVERHMAPRNVNALCVAKLMNNGLTSPLVVGGATGRYGVSRRRLLAALGASAQDSRDVPRKGFSQIAALAPLLPSATPYALDWVDTLFSYDLSRSIAPHKPLLETELHSLSQGGWRSGTIPAAHVYATQQLGAVSGVAATQMWYWGRRGFSGASNVDPSQEFAGGNFAMSALTQPLLLDAYARSELRLNAVAEHVAALADAPPGVYLLWLSDDEDDMANGDVRSALSPVAARRDAWLEPHLAATAAAYSLAAQLQMRVGIAFDADSIRSIPPGAALVIANLDAIGGGARPGSAIRAATAAAARGVRIVAAGSTVAVSATVRSLGVASPAAAAAAARVIFDVADDAALQALGGAVGGAANEDASRPLVCVPVGVYAAARAASIDIDGHGDINADVIAPTRPVFGAHCRSAVTACPLGVDRGNRSALSSRLTADSAAEERCHVLSAVNLLDEPLRVRVERSARSHLRGRGIALTDFFTGVDVNAAGHTHGGAAMEIELPPHGSRMLLASTPPE